jgi:hypothetical protein
MAHGRVRRSPLQLLLAWRLSLFRFNRVFPAGNFTGVVKSSTDDLGLLGLDTIFGTGRVNSAKAVALALSTQPSGQNPPPPPTSDTTAPSIVISSPTNGGRLSNNTTSVYVNVSDNVGVTKVELYFDGALVNTSASAPFTTKVNTRKVASGAHTLQTKAYDAAGNSALSASVTAYK